MLRKYTKRIVKIFVSIAFLFWVIFKVDWKGVVSELGSVRLEFLFLYALATLVGMIICAYKWKILADYKEIKLSLAEFFKYYLAGTFINNFMPSFIGGDTFKAYEVGKRQGKYIEAASSVVIDRITGLFAITILALSFSLLNLKAVLGSPILVTVNTLVFFSSLFGIFIIIVRKKSFWSRFKKVLPEKLMTFMSDSEAYSKGSGVMKKAILWGMAFDFVGIAFSNYILFLALGAEISILNYLSVIFLISIISSLPVSINNIGIKEWAYITFFGVFGLPSSTVVAVAIVGRIVQMLMSFFALPVYLRRTKK